MDIHLEENVRLAEPFETPTIHQVAYFLNSLSIDEIQQFLAVVQNPLRRMKLASSIISLPFPMNCTEPPEPPLVLKQPFIPPKYPRFFPVDKSKKALNAFVAFRCYYIQCDFLRLFPMKKVSSIIGKMWATDPNQPLWFLISKAWSHLRDQIGKRQAPLDVFLRLVCPYLCIPEPELYLALLDWILSVDDEGNPVVHRAENYTGIGSFAAGVSPTSVSVVEIIEHVQSIGYAQEYMMYRDPTLATFWVKDPKSTEGKTRLKFIKRLDRLEEQRLQDLRTAISPEAAAIRAEQDAYHNELAKFHPEDYEPIVEMEISPPDPAKAEPRRPLDFVPEASFMTYFTKQLNEKNVWTAEDQERNRKIALVAIGYYNPLYTSQPFFPAPSNPWVANLFEAATRPHDPKYADNDPNLDPFRPGADGQITLPNVDLLFDH
ncbi:mating-type protein MAT alpha 1-domain-containing protein [Dendryphion nanum]|uniref:Mating-type protein MAT-1 n=1 Tax=Dendryphion nanum TaxID=256645 RepID=A0A9P9DX94_9PLEO|nr:mating-type protein MAT alpha 1-domain-containing protein [Dendryphion nanum]